MRWGGAGSIGASSAALVLLLAGCAGDPAPVATSGAPRAVVSSSPTPTPAPTPTVFLGTGVSLRYSCDELVDPEVIAALDKDLVVDPSYVPDASSSAERSVAIRGTACRWKDRATGTSLIVTAAHPDPPTLADILATTRAYATATSRFGNDVSGYLVNTQAEIFTRTGYWATATSPLFADPSKATPIMSDLQDNLPG